MFKVKCPYIHILNSTGDLQYDIGSIAMRDLHNLARHGPMWPALTCSLLLLHC